ncbi:MAG TPA: SRPBCC family protein, partial [Sphingobacteriaceae bacterium]
VKLPVAQISWDAEIVEDQPGFMIGWHSVPGSTIHNAGKVEFRDAPGGSGTIVNVVISYTPPAGGIGTAVGQLLTPVFEKMVREDVSNFKSYMEGQGKVPAANTGLLDSPLYSTL